MTLGDWLATFRQLHERARLGQLSPREQAIYRAGRDELARAMVAAQRLALKPGETPRRALRVARALQVDLDFATSRERGVTLDLCTGGFSCLLSKAPPLGDEVRYELRIPASEPLRGRARVGDVNARAGNVRVAFTFVALDDADRERLETFVFDTVLGALAS
jgi:hypothetical protein